MDKCPVDSALRGLDLTSAAAALAADCSLGEVSRARNGGPVPRKLAALLREAGVGVDDLLLEQERFRRRQADQIRERISGCGGPIPAHKQAVGGVTK